MRSIVIGLGEVGKGVQDVLECDGFDIKDGQTWSVGDFDGYDALHIAIPYQDYFSDTVRQYEWDIHPRVTIIYSTVPIGTCKALNAVHSPVEGHHPNVTGSIGAHTRWFGSSNPQALLLAEEVWEGHGVEIRTVDSAGYTEFLKLRSTSRYGINIAFADYEASVARDIDMPYELLNDYDRDYNDLYRILSKGGSDMQRYILSDPEGFIGGHCVVPNAELLQEQYPHNMLLDIIELGAAE